MRRAASLDNEEAAEGRDLDRLAHRFRVDLGDRAGRAGAGIVEHDIGFAERASACPRTTARPPPARRRRRRTVRRRSHRRAAPACRCCGPPSPTLRPGRREAAGNRGADAGPGPDDQRGSDRECLSWFSPPHERGKSDRACPRRRSSLGDPFAGSELNAMPVRPPVPSADRVGAAAAPARWRRRRRP